MKEKSKLHENKTTATATKKNIKKGTRIFVRLFNSTNECHELSLSKPIDVNATAEIKSHIVYSTQI